MSRWSRARPKRARTQRTAPEAVAPSHQEASFDAASFFDAYATPSPPLAEPPPPVYEPTWRERAVTLATAAKSPWLDSPWSASSRLEADPEDGEATLARPRKKRRRRPPKRPTPPPRQRRRVWPIVAFVLALMCIGLTAGLLVVLIPRDKAGAADAAGPTDPPKTAGGGGISLASKPASAASSGRRPGRPGATSAPSDSDNTASAAASAPSGAPTQDGTLKNDALAAHDEIRAKHQSGSMIWDDALAAGAQSYAEGCVFEHSKGDYGENLFMGVKPYEGVYGWAKEEENYNYDDPGGGDFMKWGHFTQVVWKASTKLGCGYAESCGYFLCRYQPAGNMGGGDGKYYAENVLPPA